MSTKLSSLNLTHFTDLPYLKNILLNGFYARYSEEDVFSIVFDKKEDKQFIPMVCFCDIPLTLIEKHCKLYNSYGIGLTKTWAKKNKINPVVYSHSKSSFIENIRKNQIEKEKYQSDLFIKSELKKINIPTKKGSSVSLYDDIQSKQLSNFKKSVLFLKPIEGNTIRRGKLFQNVKFYDEKEWRYIPQFTNPPIISSKKLSSGLEKFKLSDGSDVAIHNINDLNNLITNNLLQNFKKYHLEFDIDTDVKYILLKEDSEVFDFIVFLNTNKIQLKLDDSKLKKLYSKIFTIQQLEDDF